MVPGAIIKDKWANKHIINTGIRSGQNYIGMYLSGPRMYHIEFDISKDRFEDTGKTSKGYALMSNELYDIDKK